MFRYIISEELNLKINKLLKKDKKKADIIYKKIKQIINSDSESINHYKNLKNNLKELKRVHIDRSFVLVFHVNLNENLIIFTDFDHHDNIYKK